MNEIQVGERVTRTKGYPSDKGRSGVVIDVHGTLAGDTLITVREDDGTTFDCYTRQVEGEAVTR